MKHPKPYFQRRLINSATLMTYGSFLARSLNLVILLPLVLTQMDSGEIFLWYLFASIASLQLLADSGFSPTFSRIVAYAMSGEGIDTIDSPIGTTKGNPNWESLERIYACMRHLYIRLGFLWFALMSAVGSAAVFHPIDKIDGTSSAWIAWLVLILSSSVSFAGIRYSSYLQGINQIATLRRWEILFSILSTTSCALALIIDGSLLSAIIAQQFWVVMNTLKNRTLSQSALGGAAGNFDTRSFDKEVLRLIWPSTWRTGIGVAAGHGIIQVSSIIYAQIATPKSATAYFLSLRLIQAVSQFSQAPFYKKLPTLASLYSQGEKAELVRVAKRGMALSHASYTTGFILLGLFGAPILTLIESNIDFPDAYLWSLMGIAFFIERYGAMHINLYSAANHIVNHIANSVAGVLFLIASGLGHSYLGIYTLPLALIFSNTLFYAPYAARHSYRKFSLSFFSFERTTMLPYLVILLIYFTVK